MPKDPTRPTHGEVEGSAADEIFGVALQRLAANLRARRLAAGLSQEAIAERTGHAVRHVQRVEAGRVNASVRLLAELAAAVGCDIAALLREPDGVERNAPNEKAPRRAPGSRRR